MAVNVPSLIVLIVLGAVLAVSYVLLGLKHNQHNYLKSPLWLGMGYPTVVMLVVFQALAAFGFLAAVLTWVFDQSPQGGILSYNRAVLPITLSVFLAGSFSWAFLLLADQPNKIAVSASLIVTALASIILLAGAAEETKPRWWVVGGLLLLALVTVLADAVIWNSRWIKS